MHKKGISLFSVEIFLSTVPENFVRKPVCVSENFWYRKNSSMRGGITVLSKIFCLTASKKNCKGTSVFQETSGIEKKLMDKRGEDSPFSDEIFLSHSAENFRSGTFQCFGKVPASKNFMHKKGISLFPVELFSSQTAKRFRKEPFNVSEKFGYRKFLCVRKGYHCFPSEKVCPTVPKNFVRNPSVFQKLLVSKKK